MYSLAPSICGMPDFISTLAFPLTNIRLSLAECQCHGITHPVSALMSTTAGPLLGSPFWTARGEQPGSTGRVANLFVAAVAAFIWSPNCAHAEELKSAST